MMFSKLQLVCLALTIPLALGACAMRKQPALGATGAEIFDASACSSCHGESLGGTSTGPPLLGLSAVWERKRLAEFLGDPGPFFEQDERLQQLDSGFSASMPGYDNLSPDERDRLAGYLLSH